MFALAASSVVPAVIDGPKSFTRPANDNGPLRLAMVAAIPFLDLNAVQAGVDFRKAGKPISANPFPEDTEEFRLFEIGWNDGGVDALRSLASEIINC